MKVLFVGPNIDDPNQISGIISLLHDILETTQVDHDYFARSPKITQKNIWGKIKWIDKIPKFIKKCRIYKPDIIHIHTALDHSAIKRDVIWVLISSFLHIRVLLHIHGGKYLFELPKKKIINNIIGKIIKLSHSIIVLSEREKNEITNNFNLNTKPIYVLENAINKNKIPDLNYKDFNFVNPNILFFGRITERKGVDDLISALTELKNEGIAFHFHLYGQGDLKDKMVSILKSELDNQFSFHGVVNGNEKWRALNNADIFILPSRYGEGLPIAILEAMSLGKIVVATDDASIGIVIKNKFNGFIIEKHNSNSIVEVIKMILTSETCDISRVKQNAITTIETKYSIITYIKKLENIYSNIIA